MLHSSDISEEIHEGVDLATVVEEACIITDVDRDDGAIGVDFVFIKADIVNL